MKLGGGRGGGACFPPHVACRQTRFGACGLVVPGLTD